MIKDSRTRLSRSNTREARLILALWIEASPIMNARYAALPRIRKMIWLSARGLYLPRVEKSRARRLISTKFAFVYVSSSFSLAPEISRSSKVKSRFNYEQDRIWGVCLTGLEKARDVRETLFHCNIQRSSRGLRRKSFTKKIIKFLTFHRKGKRWIHLSNVENVNGVRKIAFRKKCFEFQREQSPLVVLKREFVSVCFPK